MSIKRRWERGGVGREGEDDERRVISLAEMMGKAVHVEVFCICVYVCVDVLCVATVWLQFSTWKSDAASISPAGHICT